MQSVRRPSLHDEARTLLNIELQRAAMNRAGDLFSRFFEKSLLKVEDWLPSLTDAEMKEAHLSPFGVIEKLESSEVCRLLVFVVCSSFFLADFRSWTELPFRSLEWIHLDFSKALALSMRFHFRISKSRKLKRRRKARCFLVSLFAVEIILCVACLAC